MSKTITANKSDGGKIHALTSLRFFAALYVVLVHANALFFPRFASESSVVRVFGFGYISVSFFFLLSGYILAAVYLRRGTPVRKGAFFRARFARVYPLFLLTLLLDAPNLVMARLPKYGMLKSLEMTGVTFAGKMLMLQGWIPQIRGIDDPNWSLAAETIFYLSFPFIGIALWKLRGRWLWITACLLYIGGQLLVWFGQMRLPWIAVHFMPVFHITTFAVGILLARWQWLLPADTAANERRRDRLAGVVTVMALLCVAAAIVLAPVPYTTADQNPNLNDGLLAPAFAAVIWAFSRNNWRPAQWLHTRWLVVLGEASFGLYLFHVPILHYFERLGWSKGPWFFVLFMASSIGISVLSFYYFETPAREWILKKKSVHNKETLEMASNAQ